MFSLEWKRLIVLQATWQKQKEGGEKKEEKKEGQAGGVTKPNPVNHSVWA